jgi:hypothetical protein
MGAVKDSGFDVGKMGAMEHTSRGRKYSTGIFKGSALPLSEEEITGGQSGIIETGSFHNNPEMDEWNQGKNVRVGDDEFTNCLPQHLAHSREAEMVSMMTHVRKMLGDGIAQPPGLVFVAQRGCKRQISRLQRQMGNRASREGSHLPRSLESSGKGQRARL